MNEASKSLITSDAKTGLALAGTLADQLQSQIEQAYINVERPGGTNYRLPPEVPREITISILFYAISIANAGWPVKS